MERPTRPSTPDALRKFPRMTEPTPSRPTRFRTGGLSQRKPTRFSWTPDAEARAALVRDLRLLALDRLDFTGQIEPRGRDEFRLEAKLTAVAAQPCIVTLAPVRSEIAETVIRRYVAGLTPAEGDEIEIPEDDSLEPLPETLDLTEIAIEALMLALPLYPRAKGAEFGGATQAPAGVAPIPETTVKPFSGLAALADKLKNGSADGNDKDR